MQNTSNKKSDETIIYSTFSPPPQIKMGFSTKGRTKQSFKDECDINVIIARFLKTGVMDFVQKNEPRYGDVTGLEFQSAMLMVAGAKSMFNELPAQLRARFGNDPGAFLTFVGDERNRAEALELGLLKPEAHPALEEDPPPRVPEAHASHEPLRARDGTYREHTRAETRAEAKAAKAAAEAADRAASED